MSFGTRSSQNLSSCSKFGSRLGSFSLEATVTKNFLNSLAISRGSVYSLPSIEIALVAHFELFFVAPNSLNNFQTLEGLLLFSSTYDLYCIVLDFFYH